MDPPGKSGGVLSGRHKRAARQYQADRCRGNVDRKRACQSAGALVAGDQHRSSDGPVRPVSVDRGPPGESQEEAAMEGVGVVLRSAEVQLACGLVKVVRPAARIPGLCFITIDAILKKKFIL